MTKTQTLRDYLAIYPKIFFDRLSPEAVGMSHATYYRTLKKPLSSIDEDVLEVFIKAMGIKER